MEKQKILEIIAQLKINVSLGGLSANETNSFVRLTIGSGKDKLYVFDHRPATILAVKNTRTDSIAERSEAYEVLVQAINQPAKVVLMAKTDGRRIWNYILLYPTNQEPKALFSETRYVARGGYTWFEIQEDKPLWSWRMEASSQEKQCYEMTIVALTDEKNRVVIKNFDRLTRSSSRTTISSEILETMVVQEEDNEALRERLRQMSPTGRLLVTLGTIGPLWKEKNLPS